MTWSNNLDITTVILTHRLDDRLKAAINSARPFSNVLVGVTNNQPWPDWLKSNSDQVNATKIDQVTSFATNRNLLLKLVKTTWVLFLDSDEVVSDELRLKILSTLPNTKYDGFLIKRVDIWHDQTINYGEAGHTNLLRLFKSKKGEWQRAVHEIVVLDELSKLGKIPSPIWHYPHPTISEFLAQIFNYARQDAQYRYGRGEKATWLGFMKPLAKFGYNYFWLQGWRDGITGFIYAFIMSLHSLLVRIYLYELANQH